MNEELDARSVPEVLAALSADLRALISETAGLARSEISRASSALTISTVGIIAGAIVLLLGVAALAAALVLIGIALGLYPWAAALLVGLLLCGGGAITIWVFLAQLKTVDYNLTETRRSVTETLTWLKAQTLP